MYVYNSECVVERVAESYSEHDGAEEKVSSEVAVDLDFKACVIQTQLFLRHIDEVIHSLLRPKALLLQLFPATS